MVVIQFLTILFYIAFEGHSLESYEIITVNPVVDF